MNYRTMLKGALALSLGLIVGTASAATTTQTDAAAAYEETFEAVAITNGMPITDAQFHALDSLDDNKPYGWLASEGDESKVIAGGPTGSTKALQLNTDAGTLTNQLQKSVRDSLNNGIDGTDGAGAYIETEAKFVASDTLDAGVRGGVDDTKFAIYAYTDENAATTNLVVFHKYIDTNDDEHYTNEQFGAVNCDVYTKLRIEMKQMEDSGGTLVNVFSVKVNDGAALTSDLAFADGIWFLTAENTDVAANKKLSSLNFKGTGEIDNLKAGVITETTEYTIAWTAQNATVTNAAGTTLTAADTNFLAGATLTFTPDTNMVITNVLVDGAAVSFDPASYTYTVGSADAVVTVLAGVAPFFPRTATAGQDGTAAHPFEIADVDDIQALKAAFADNASWQSLNYKLVADIDATDLGYWDGIGTYNVANSGLNGGTLDGDGHTISNLKFSTGKYRGFFNRMDNATITNLTINVVDIQETAAAEHGYAAFVGTMNNSKLVDCVATGTIGTTAKPAMHTSAGFAVKTDGGAVLVNCTNYVNIVCSLNDNPKVAGILGLVNGNAATVSNCWNFGRLTATPAGVENAANGVGGLVGYSQGNLAIYGGGNEGIVEWTKTTAAHSNNKAINVGTIIGMQTGTGKSATVSDGVVAQADAAPLGSGIAQVSGLNFATFDNNVATFVADDALAAGNTYKVMLSGATATYEFAEAGTIAFDKTLFTPTFAITAAEGLEVTNDAGSPVVTFTAAAVAPTYTVDWTGSTNVTVTIDGEAWDGGTVGTATNGAVVTFTPDQGMVITNVDGEAVGHLNSFTLTVTQNTNIVVIADTVQPIGRIKPEWAADADTTKFWNWVDDKNVSDYASVDYTTEYLLNTAVGEDPAPAITITGITVGATATTIEVRGTVGRGIVDFANLNGVLNVAVGSSVTALTPKAIPAANLDTSVEGVATITIPNGDGCFFRAGVDFAAPQSSLTAVSE